MFIQHRPPTGSGLWFIIPHYPTHSKSCQYFFDPTLAYPYLTYSFTFVQPHLAIYFDYVSLGQVSHDIEYKLSERLCHTQYWYFIWWNCLSSIFFEIFIDNLKLILTGCINIHHHSTPAHHLHSVIHTS